MAQPLAIYFFDLEGVELTALQALAAEWLPADERAVAGRYRQPARSCQYLAGRLLLRGLLARSMGAEPAAFELTLGPYGKPSLPGGPPFNLAHTEHWVALAFGGDSEVGVDIEVATRRLKPLELAEAVMHPEEWTTLRALEPTAQLEYFLAIWSAKEAYLKALGRGIAYGLTRLRVDLPAQRVIGPEGVTPLLPITSPPHHAAALVSLGHTPVPPAQYHITQLANLARPDTVDWALW